MFLLCSGTPRKARAKRRRQSPVNHRPNYAAGRAAEPGALNLPLTKIRQSLAPETA